MEKREQKHFLHFYHPQLEKPPKCNFGSFRNSHLIWLGDDHEMKVTLTPNIHPPPFPRKKRLDWEGLLLHEAICEVSEMLRKWYYRTTFVVYEGR